MTGREYFTLLWSHMHDITQQFDSVITATSRDIGIFCMMDQLVNLDIVCTLTGRSNWRIRYNGLESATYPCRCSDIDHVVWVCQRH